MNSQSVTNDSAAFSSNMQNFEQLCDIPANVWDGQAKSTFESETKAAISEFTAIIPEQFTLFNDSISKYNDYCQEKAAYAAAQTAYANATTEEEKAQAAAEMEAHYQKMESLRAEINELISEIIGMTVEGVTPVPNVLANGLSASLSKGLPALKTIDNIPSGLGDTFTYMGWQCITSRNSNQYKLMEAIGGVDNHFDSEGFGRINGRYVIACTTTYGNVGDYVDFVQSNGNVIKCVIGDIKSRNDAGCTEWGHKYGQNIVEFVVDKDSWYNSGHPNPGTSSFHPEWKDTIVKAVNYGSYYDNPSFTG